MLEHWLPVALWAAVIFTASTNYFSFANTAKTWANLAGRLFPQRPTQRLMGVHVYARKLGHWVGYFILTLLIARALEYQFPDHSQQMRLIWSVILAGLYAVSDELHQAALSQRVGSLADVAIAVTGALCAAAVLALWR